MTNTKKVVCLIATRPRIESLLSVALPSVATQIRLPSEVFVVSDNREFTQDERRYISDRFPNLSFRFLRNENSPGAAGTWNTGLNAIYDFDPTSYVAIIDDDDFWDQKHLSICYETASSEDWPDIVISGLRMIKDKVEIPRPLIKSISIEDFLVGNPGWQGSNTFVHINALSSAGYFTDGLQSSNDRDLAIRLLSVPGIRVSFTNEFSANWRLEAEPDCLSRRRGPEKIIGLRQFISLHGNKMSPEQFTQFADRCFKLFGVTEKELLA